MEIRKIKSRKIYEQISDQLKQFIIKGELKPGEKLPSTKELSDRFQVGRSTVREALSALSAMGLVDIRQGEGCFVRRFDHIRMDFPTFQLNLLSQETITELIEARSILELANVKLAAERRSDEQLARLAEIVSFMAVHLENEIEFKKLDIQFHTVLAEATQNPTLMRLLKSLSSQIHMLMDDTWNIRMHVNADLFTEFLNEHEDILKAIKEQNPTQAWHAMSHHLRHVEALLLQQLKGSAQTKSTV